MVSLEVNMDIGADIEVEAEIEVEADIEVEAGIEFDAGIEFEVGIEVEPEVEIEVEIDAPVIEVEVPILEVNVGGDIDIGFDAKSHSIEEGGTAQVTAKGNCCNTPTCNWLCCTKFIVNTIMIIGKIIGWVFIILLGIIAFALICIGIYLLLDPDLKFGIPISITFFIVFPV